MLDWPSESRQTTLTPLTLFALTFLVAGLGFVIIGPLIGFFLSIPFFEGSLNDQVSKLTDPIGHPEFRLPMYIMQGAATFIGLAVVPLLFWFSVTGQGVRHWFAGQKIYAIAIAATVVITFAFIVVDSVFIEWNANASFPSWLKEFESWARESENRAEEITKFLTQFSGPNGLAEFAIAFFVIAVLPAVGEELVFRGMLQTTLTKATRSPHVGIWGAAILFSAFHLQFFGFVPRMLLGALFGYLYYWSANLWVPMIAHFVNNGFSVVMLFLFQRGAVDVDMESTDAAPWPAVAIFTLLGGGTMYYFKNFYDNKKIADAR